MTRRLLLVFCCCAAYVGGLKLVASLGQTLVMITARSEQAEFEASNPTLAAIGVNNATLISDSPKLSAAYREDGVCVRGLLTPSLGAKVVYRSHDVEVLTISVDAGAGEVAGSFAFEEGGEIELGPSANVIVNTGADAACRTDQRPKLPIWGAALIGEVLRGQSDLASGPSAVLLEGEAAVYGRAALSGGLYEVKTARLPPGGYVESDPSLPNRARDWWGVVRVDDDGALLITASTESDALHILAPGPHSTPEALRISVLERALNDPLLIWAQLLLVVAVTIVQTMLNLVQLRSSGGKE